MSKKKLYESLTPLEVEGLGSSEQAWVLTEGNRVLDFGGGEAPQATGAQQTVDGKGLYLTPAFTDIHCHGGAGVSFEETEKMDEALKIHRGLGTGQILASLVTNPLPELLNTLGALADFIEAQPESERGLAGIHLEGPFLSPSHRGAHNPDFLKAPSADQARELIDAARGHLRQITLAPETDRDLEALSVFVEAGVRVAVGHTDADYETASAAFEAGASVLTHTFNAMSPLLHRAPGPIAAALDHEHVLLELICDGVHVHAPSVRALWAMAPGRVALITDAMAAAGCHDGHYMLGTLDVDVVDSVARLREGGAIAGSTLTMSRAVETAVSFGLPLAEVVAASTTLPASRFGLSPLPGMNILDAQGRLLDTFLPRTK